MKLRKLFWMAPLAIFCTQSCTKQAPVSNQTGDVKALDVSRKSANSSYVATVGLKAAFASYFRMGVASNNDSIASSTASALIAHEFNSFTPDNAMKWKYIHPRFSGGNADGDYFWDKMTAIVNFAKAHGMAVRGHCLVWRNPDVLPRYKLANGSDAPYGYVTHDQLTVGSYQMLDRGRFFARMNFHIKTVMQHYGTDVYAYDVVNEAITDDANATDPYKTFPGEDMYKVCSQGGKRGADYIDSAFVYAHRAMPSAQLFYNDNRVEDDTKRGRIKTMLLHLKNDLNIPVSIGIQAHWWADVPTKTQLDATIKTFTDVGIPVHITELDISIYNQADNTAYPNSPNPYTTARKAAQTTAYVNAFSVFEKYKDQINNVTFWNLGDKDSWRRHYPVDRLDYPMFFGDFLETKPVYNSVVSAIP